MRGKERQRTKKKGAEGTGENTPPPQKKKFWLITCGMILNTLSTSDFNQNAAKMSSMFLIRIIANFVILRAQSCI